MSEPAPKQYRDIVDGKVPLEGLYERGWECARYDMSAASELDRALRIRLAIESVNANNELRDSVDKLNRDSTRIASIAILVAFASMAISVAGYFNQRTESDIRNQNSVLTNSDKQQSKVSP